MRILLSHLALYVSSAALWAQSIAGSGVISGKVTDQSGEGMPEAGITIENRTIGVRRDVQSSLDGVFEITGLPPAAGYRMWIAHKRYLDWASPEFEVLIGRRTSFEIAMQPENPEADSESAPLLPEVDHTNSPIGTTLSESQLDTLPAAGRQWASLVLLAPAVTGGPGPGIIAMRGDARSNAGYVDGLLTTNTYPGGGSAPVGRLAQDAVQGMEVLSAAAPVEFGHAMGGAVNAAIRSGGNDFHGDIYGYFANDSLDAIDRYALGNKLFGKRYQPGFNLGGKIPNSKLFFFSNLEVLHADGQGLNRITNPLIADCTATAAQCAAAASFIQSQMDVLVPRSERAVSGVFKIDYRHSDRNTLSLAAHASHSSSPLGTQDGWVSPNGGLLGDAVLQQDTHYGKLEWISAPSPASNNEFRLGLFHDRLASSESSTGLSTGKASVMLAGAQIGEAFADPSVMRERRFQLVDHLRASSGAHTFLVGVDYTRTQDWIGALSNANGTYYYTSLTAFAQDLGGSGQKSYTYFTQTLGNPVRKLSTPELGVYVQDTWHISPRLQATAGVRWSKQFLPQPAEQNSTYYATGELRSPNINADPRIGVSYLIDKRTVLRASFGMYHAPHSGELIDALFLGNGIYQSSLLLTPGQTGSPVFPAALAADSSAPTGSLNIMYGASKLRNPYTRQTTFSIARDLGAGLTATAAYVTSSGVKLWTADDKNLGSSSTATYTVQDAAGNWTYQMPVWTSRSNADVAHVYEVANGGSSWYRGLVLQLDKRMGRGFRGRAAYTWSHAIDDVGGVRIAHSVPVGTYNNDRRADTGTSSYDQRHRATIDLLWQPTMGRGYFLNGWEISSIATFASSQPATALVQVDGQQMAFPGSLNGTGGWPRVPFLPISSLNAGPEYTVNARIARSVPITERVTGRLVFEAFNLFNTQFDTSVNTVAYTASGGVLTPVSGVGAGNAARGYTSGSNARNCQVAFRLTF
jgi:hypothetical protein